MGVSNTMGSKKEQQQSWNQNFGSTVWEPQQGYLAGMYDQGNQQMLAQQGYSMGPNGPVYTGRPQEYQDAQKNLSQMQGSYDTANTALSNGNQYMGQAADAMNAANPNFASAESAYGNAMQGYNQGYGATNQAMNQFGTANQDLNKTGIGMNQGYDALNQAQNAYNSFMNPGMNPMQDVYARNIAQNFRENIMPELQGQAMMAGGMGGSRANIGEALAGARASQQLQDFSAQLYDQDMNRKLAATQGLNQVGDSYGGMAMNQANIAGMRGNLAQGMGQLGMNYGNLASGQAGVGQGLGQLGSARVGQGSALGNLGVNQAQLAQGYQNNAAGYGGLAQMGMALPWYAAQQQAGLLGNPAMRNIGSVGAATGSGSSWNQQGAVSLTGG